MAEHIHLMGIGGIGMSAIARLLLEKGSFTVSGCDLKENELIKGLRQAGVSVNIGHSPKHLQSVDKLVYSTAIPEASPEIQAAKQGGIQLMKRAEILSLLMQDKSVVSVTGMHGKTTTASLAAYLLSEAGLFPTVAVGGILQNLGGNAFLGKGRFFVAEADESDGSFLYCHPDYSIITNIDYEHLDYYQDIESIQKTFRRFINQTRQAGCLFFWQDDPYLNNLLKGYKKRAVSFGLTQQAEVYASHISLQGLSSEFDCRQDKKLIGHFRINLGGRHNILNALAVIALGMELGIDSRLIKTALGNYQGTKRRLEVKFQSRETLVLDDYGHHPTEIKATLEAIKSLNPRRILVVFQPHRYTRTKFLLEEFAGCFNLADFVILTDIYPAGEPAIKGVSSYSIYERMKSKQYPGRLKFLARQDILNYLLGILNPQDVVLILGAGDITRISDELAEALKRQAKDKREVSQAYQL